MGDESCAFITCVDIVIDASDKVSDRELRRGRRWSAEGKVGLRGQGLSKGDEAPEGVEVSGVGLAELPECAI